MVLEQAVCTLLYRTAQSHTDLQTVQVTARPLNCNSTQTSPLWLPAQCMPLICLPEPAAWRTDPVTCSCGVLNIMPKCYWFALWVTSLTLRPPLPLPCSLAPPPITIPKLPSLDLPRISATSVWGRRHMDPHQDKKPLDIHSLWTKTPKTRIVHN